MADIEPRFWQIKILTDEYIDFTVSQNNKIFQCLCAYAHNSETFPLTLSTVVKFTSYKEKEAILKKARRIRPEGLNIFEDLAEETMEKRRAQLPQLKQAKAEGKLAYFSLDKLIIRDRPPGQIHA